MKQNNLNLTKQILNKKLKKERKNLLFKIIQFFFKDPDLYVGSGSGQKSSRSATLPMSLRFIKDFPSGFQVKYKSVLFEIFTSRTRIIFYSDPPQWHHLQYL